MTLPRRAVVTGSLAGLAAGLLPRTARAANLIPQRASSRVIVDNDFAGDPDGLVALAHQLLSPKARVALITTTALNAKFVEPALAGRAAAAGAAIARECAALAGRRDIAIVPGPETFDAAPSPAARAIVAEALHDDPLPLFVTCGGPLTNVAAALRLEPAIARRMTVVWIGGGGYPDGGWEYNLATDPAAARAVIEDSAVPLWQVPQPAYRQMQFSVAEMAADMRGISPLGSWLYERFTHPPAFIDVGGAWPLGDSPLVLLTAVSAESSHAVERTARRIGADVRYGEEIAGRTVRVFEQLDVRLAWADFLAKLRLAG
ncbi:MAG: nucleoside hydrolase [Sphingomonadales bacterium]|nr:nucleoside hydrolase [Sphingomonadales bacterium]